jgi:hypothetical protein
MAVEDTDLAHRHSIRHRKEIESSAICGCFYCIAIFDPSLIVCWTDFDGGVGQTALCPECSVDSVIGSSSGYPITVEFLRAMYDRWF